MRSRVTKGARGGARAASRSPSTYPRNARAPSKNLTKFYGVQACAAIFQHRRSHIQRVFVANEMAGYFADVLQWCKEHEIPYKLGPGTEISRVAATEHHEGVCFEAHKLPTLSMEEVLKRTKQHDRRCVVVLEGVENPHNIGAIIRTLGFFGATALIVVSQQGSVLSGAACRVAEGGAEVMSVVHAQDALPVVTKLRAAGFDIIATTPHNARSVYTVDWPKHVAIFFGSEGSGLSTKLLELADERVVIPRVGSLESLNVGAAVASILTEVRRCALAG